MQPGFIFVLFALGTFISIISAAPANSEIQHDDDSEMTDKEQLVEVLKQIENQANPGDKELAKAEFLKSFFKNNWRNLLGIGTKLIGNIRNSRPSPTSYYPAPRQQQPYYSSYYGNRRGYGSAKAQEKKELMIQQINAELQAQLMNKILKDLTATKEQNEEADNDDGKVQEQSIEAVEELEDLLAAKEQDEGDRDAATMKAADSADPEDEEEEEEKDDDDNEGDNEAELQRLRGKRRRHKSRNRFGRRRGHRHRSGHRRHGKGGRHHRSGRGHKGRRPGGRRSPSWIRTLPWTDILNGVGTFAGGLLGNFLNPSPPRPAYWEEKRLKLQQMGDDYDDIDDLLQAQSGAQEKELEDLLAATQQDEELFDEIDDDDVKLQAQSEVLKEFLKTLIAAKQQ